MVSDYKNQFSALEYLTNSDFLSRVAALFLAMVTLSQIMTLYLTIPSLFITVATVTFETLYLTMGFWFFMKFPVMFWISHILQYGVTN